MVGPGVVVTGFGPDAAVITDGAVVWEGERIVAVGPYGALAGRYPGAEHLEVDGNLILPGLVNLHHHAYSALARGLDPGIPMHDFGRVLRGLWWRLDRALDEETVRLSAELTLAACIRWGCTTLFDHHASPSFLRGSLDLIGLAAERSGIRAVLCYEVSDRNGHHEALAGLEENLDFAVRHRDHPSLRGMLGLHASFTLSDETLSRVGRDRPGGVGIHVHVAEDPLDVELSWQRYGAGPVERLERAGLLDRLALLVHGVHLEEVDLETVAASGAVLVHNPESNANNAVGTLDLARALGAGCRVGLGTDGMSSRMLGSLRSALLAQRSLRGDPGCCFTEVAGLLEVNARRAAEALGEPLLGRLEPGAPADLVVLEDVPPTPPGPENILGHLVYGASESPVRHTIARGRILLRDGRHTTLDPATLAAEARATAPYLWERFASLGGDGD